METTWTFQQSALAPFYCQTADPLTQPSSLQPQALCTQGISSQFSFSFSQELNCIFNCVYWYPFASNICVLYFFNSVTWPTDSLIVTKPFSFCVDSDVCLLGMLSTIRVMDKLTSGSKVNKQIIIKDKN